MVKLHSNGSFSLDNLQNKSLICLDSHMKYITFKHLSGIYNSYSTTIMIKNATLLRQ